MVCLMVMDVMGREKVFLVGIESVGKEYGLLLFDFFIWGLFF